MTHVIKKNDCDDINQSTAEFINGLDSDFVIDKIDITEDEAVIEFHQMEHGTHFAVRGDS
jgi:hypothetical protein